MSAKSKIGTYVYPCAIRHALYRLMFPPSLNFVKKTYLDPTIFALIGCGTKHRVSYCRNVLSSSIMTACHIRLRKSTLEHLSLLLRAIDLQARHLP